jgi:hypothetical protein
MENKKYAWWLASAIKNKDADWKQIAVEKDPWLASTKKHRLMAGSHSALFFRQTHFTVLLLPQEGL